MWQKKSAVQTLYGVAVLVWCATMPLGDRCPTFWDNMMVSSSRVEISVDVTWIFMDFFDPWRWDHHIVSTHQAPVTQWHGTIFRKNGALNWAARQVAACHRLTFQNCVDDNYTWVVRITVLNVFGAVHWALLFMPWRLCLKIVLLIKDFLNVKEQCRCSSTSKPLSFSFLKAIIILQLM